jgi:hypothetical protein
LWDAEYAETMDFLDAADEISTLPAS